MISSWILLKIEPTNFLMDWMQDLMGHVKDFGMFCPKRKRSHRIYFKQGGDMVVFVVLKDHSGC